MEQIDEKTHLRSDLIQHFKIPDNVTMVGSALDIFHTLLLTTKHICEQDAVCERSKAPLILG